MVCNESANSFKERNSNSYISIHATILSIFIAIFVAFSIYHNGILYNLENNVINEAKKINEINFIRSVYYPDVGFEDFRSVNTALKYERTERLQIKKKEEKDISIIKYPTTSDDIIELFRYLHFLTYPFPRSDEGYSLGNNKFIPRDSANRGEEILRVFNILGHCYLFPEAPFDTDGMYKKGVYNKKYWGNLGELREWLDDLNIFANESKSFLMSIYLFPEIEHLRALQVRDQKLIERWESHLILKSYGHIKPEKLYNDFVLYIKQVINIANDTQYQINRFDNFKVYYPSKTTSYIFYFLIGFVFLCSVIAPMIIPKIPKYFYIHIPIIFYVGLYLYGFYELLN